MNIRQTPNGKIIDTVNSGAILKITGDSDGQWWPIQLLPTNHNGWMLEIGSGGVELIEPFLFGEFINIKDGYLVKVADSKKYDGLNLRDTPNGNIIAKLDEGEVLEVIDGPSDDVWWKLRRSHDGQEGWSASVDRHGAILIIPISSE